MKWTEGVDLKDRFMDRESSNKLNKGSLLVQYGFGFIQKCKDQANKRFAEVLSDNDIGLVRSERKRDVKRKSKKHKKHGKQNRSSSQESGIAGPKIPEGFLENDSEEDNLRKDQVLDSYKRPKKQRAATEPLHPADERKILVEKALKEQQIRELTVR